ncbi:MAG: hypothetical protein WA418_37615 [Bradyrhizobium sp.]
MVATIPETIPAKKAKPSMTTSMTRDQRGRWNTRCTTESTLALLGIVIAGSLILGWRIHAGSVDLGWHYSLAEFIRQSRTWPSIADSQHLSMYWHPPISHSAAAALGALFNSTLLGMNLVGIASVLMTYAAVFLLMRFVSPRATVAATILLVIILVVLKKYRVFHGREIYENYFISQMFGTMCVLWLALAWPTIARNIALEIPAAIAATLALGWVHPASAVQFAGFCLFWRGLDTARALLHGNRDIVVPALGILLLGCGLAAAIVSPPAFAMVRAQTAEAWLAAKAPRDIVVPVVLMLLLSAAGLGYLSMRGRLALARPAVFVSLCGGVAAVSAAQMAAYYAFGVGSRYAFYKHIFSLSTLLAAVAVVCAISVSRMVRQPGERWSRPARLAFAPAALVAAIACLPPWEGDAVTPLMRMEAFLRTSIADARLPGADGHAVLSADRPAIQFAYSTAILHLPSDLALTLAYGDELPDLVPRREQLLAETPVKYAFVGDAGTTPASCVIFANPRARLAATRFGCR